MKLSVVKVAFAALVSSSLLPIVSDAEDSYTSFVKTLSHTNRIAYAIATIAETTDETTLDAAIEDLRINPKSNEENTAALEALNSLLPKVKRNTENYGHVLLARASVLARLGDKDTADALFTYVLRNKLNKNAYRMYYASLWDCHQYDISAIDEFHRHTSDSLSAEDREFYHCHGNILEMFTRLRAMKLEKPDFLAMQSVFPNLSESERRPLARDIAEALCLAIDERYSEALDRLTQLDEQLKQGTAPKSEYDESKDIPLYSATILLFEGRDFVAMRDAFQEFMNRNQDNPALVLERAVKVTYGLDYSAKDIKKIPELTDYLLQSNLFTDEAIAKTLPETDRASLLNMHRKGVWEQNRCDEAYDIALKLKDEYYPQTLSGADAVMNLALYKIYLHQDFDAAERLFCDLLENGTYDKIIPHAKSYYASIFIHKGDYQKALAILDEVQSWLGDEPPCGPLARLHDIVLKLKEITMQAIADANSKKGDK